jgi:hypothetical protein
VLVIVTEQLSVACGGVHVATAPHEEFAASVMFEGQPVITGLVLSVTVTLNAHIETFPAPSVAVYFTCVVPTGKEFPGVCVLVNVTEQLSVACGGVQLAGTAQAEFPATVMLEGQPVITGLVLSMTVTLNIQIAVFPAPSVAVYFTSVVPRAKVFPGE